MASINQEAIQELNIALELIMPDALEPGVDVISTLAVLSIAPTGLGGFIQLNPEGTAFIHGRCIEACFTVFLQGNNPSNLQDSARTVIEALVGAERGTLRDNGILKIVQSGSDFQTLAGANREIKLVFDLVYEYRQLPEDIEEVIDEIPVTLSMDVDS